jgi:hypothetical protein
MEIKEKYDHKPQSIPSEVRTCLFFSNTDSNSSVVLRKEELSVDSKDIGYIVSKNIETTSDTDIVYLSAIKVYPSAQSNGRGTTALKKFVQREQPKDIYIKATSEAIEHILSKYFMTVQFKEEWYQICGVR